ncbi:MFS transporter [Sphingobium sp.]|uniref:MFS transporter n=1 Tax=Sphingobium sp. TaxID=1912891 RepID=UPI003B3B600B
MTVKSADMASMRLPDAVDVPSDPGAGKWYLLGILMLISLMGTIDRGVISVTAEPLKADFGLSDKQIGLLSGMAYSSTYALAILPMGWLVDRVNRRNLLSATVTMWSILTAACAASSSYAALFAARMGVGAAEAPVSPASMSIVADAFPASRRNTAISLFLAGSGVGVLLQFVIGGWLLAHFHWRAVFLVAGGPGIILAILLFLTTREPARGASETADDAPKPEVAKAPTMGEVLRNIGANRPLCLAIPAITLATGVFFSFVTWTTSFLVRIHDLSISGGALRIGIIFGVGMTVGCVLAGPLADAFAKGDRRRIAIVPAIGTCGGAIAGAVLTMAPSLPVALAGLGALGLMAGFSLGPGYALILSLTPPRERGAPMATTKRSAELRGGGLLSFRTGAISDAVGGSDSIRPALLSNAALLMVAVFFYLAIHRMVGRQERLSGAGTVA